MCDVTNANNTALNLENFMKGSVKWVIDLPMIVVFVNPCVLCHRDGPNIKNRPKIRVLKIVKLTHSINACHSFITFEYKTHP